MYHVFKVNERVIDSNNVGGSVLDRVTEHNTSNTSESKRHIRSRKDEGD